MARKLSYWANWRTPAFFEGKKFDTDFFIFEGGRNLHQTNQANNAECEPVEWDCPGKYLERFEQGEIGLAPPQFYILSELARLRTCTNVRKAIINRQVKTMWPELHIEDSDTYNKKYI